MLAPWKNSYVKLGQRFKEQDITLPAKVHIVNVMFFPVVRYGCEIWTRKEAECRRIDIFELWCWRRLLRVPWTGRTSNQSILKEINPEYSLEELMLQLKLKLQYSFGHLLQEPTHWKRPWCWEKLKVKEGDNRGWDGWIVSLSHDFEHTLGDSEGQGSLVCYSPQGHKEADMT